MWLNVNCNGAVIGGVFLLLAPFAWYNYLIKMTSRHEAAIFKIGPFLRQYEREALRTQWDEYNSHIQSIPGWIDQDGFYKDDKIAAEKRRAAFQALCNVTKIVACIKHLEWARWGLISL